MYWSQVDSIFTILTNISSAWLIWIGYRYRTFSAEKRNGPVDGTKADDNKAVFAKLLPIGKQSFMSKMGEFWTWHKNKSK